MTEDRSSAGYKQTEICVIPEDWGNILLGEVITLQRGFDLPSRLRKTGNIPIVSSSGVTDTHNEPSVLAPGVVTGRYGTIGEVFFINEDFWALNTTLFVSDFKGNDPLFIYFLLKKIDYKTYSGKSGVPGVNRNDLHEIPIKLPPLPEQRSIAEALSDVDTLIAALDKLIAKKRNLKTANMQQLLIGKKRLPGFGEGKGYKQTSIGVIPEDWDVVTTREITSLVTNGFVGKATTHYTDKDDGILYIQGYNVEANSFNFNGIKRVTPEFHRIHQKSCLKKYDLLTVQTGDVGLTTIIPENLIGSNCHALIISWFKKEKAYPLFYAHYFNSPMGRLRLRDLEVGTTMKHINVGDLLCWEVPYLPKLKEQIAIAQVLSDMDNEIAAIETRLTKTQAVKQGMMQELLTGRTRLI